MKRSLSLMAIPALSLACTLALRAQEIDVSILFSLPPQVQDVFEKSPLSKTHKFTSHVNPFYLQGDFNGDGKLDTAVLVKEITTGKVGIAIFHGGSSKPLLLGAGALFGNSNARSDDNLDWLNAWYIQLRGPVGQGVGEGAPPRLKGDAILAIKSESASRLVYWNGKNYVWYQQGD